VNWERVPSGTLATTVEAIQRAGHPVYLLFDSDQERASFEILHGSTAQWLPNGQRRNIQLLQASSQAGQANR